MKLIGKIGMSLIVVTLLVLLIRIVFNTTALKNKSLVTEMYNEEIKDNKEIENKDKNSNGDTDHINSGFNSDDRNTDFTPIFKREDLSQEIINKINGVSWREEAPIGLEDLSYLTVTYWDFDGQQQKGELIVHRKIAEEVVDIFEELYEERFPIAKVRLIDEYDADDNRSMEDNNTYGFCFRVIEGTQNISKHGYGVAIDINPIQNPYIRGDIVLPLAGKDYVNREDVGKGMIIKGDPCYNAFISRGWTWGGEWKTIKDYHHFQKQVDLN
ncbi:M15 family metallopeptidase [Natronincola ferrireducens]|uniref:D-alanyl-D-alanine carboxypeptidase n=1 Tax=Natronincola ferrireducens TaxID=393762 RepID=A0A1G9GMF0_9FIRM|nr:M15 family metallopeptidase [Natronincola ferrireducens]SDL01870.1 D-alanyl-D-alanine carboxypeptidase [Natronincola ferrireducens]